MAKIKKVLVSILSFVLIVVLGYLVVANYSLIFSKTIKGEIVSVKSVELPVALMTRAKDTITSEVFSFAIAIKDAETGEIYTAKSEDRQWAVVMPGQCAESVFLPYPPWDLRRRGTFFGARLIGLRDCPAGLKTTTPPAVQPKVSSGIQDSAVQDPSVNSNPSTAPAVNSPSTQQ